MRKDDVWFGIGTKISKKPSIFYAKIGSDPQNVLIFSKICVLCKVYTYLKTEI
jgi:hypothetical protein